MRKIITISIIICIILLTGCTKEEKQVELSEIEYYQYFDTVITLKVWDTSTYSRDSDLWEGAEEIIQHIQDTFERDEPESELYQLNASAGTQTPFECSDDLYEVIKIALEFAEGTQGKFDPTIGPLVDLWNITNVEESHPAPSIDDINVRKELVDYTKVVLDDENKTVLLPTEGMIIDLGGIAKGFAADQLKSYFNDKGIKHAILNLGGNIYALGTRYAEREDGNNKWSIGIRDPQEYFSTPIATVFLEDKTVVTSGIYERYIIDPNDNKMYHHILNPDTGYPVENNLNSVTIITTSSTVADALSTSIFAFGIEDGIALIETEYPDVEAVFIDKDGQIYKTSGVDTIYNFTLL